ncbi:MAG: methylated-DNA--[protein]-cysteine S-methyltransferase [Flavobacteriales bacterium]|nr:methylated-DNA--[protein]-cysteine S-methyltransferase [Flavobacteriales bacterium]
MSTAIRRTRAPELFAPLHVAVVEGPIGKVFLESDGALITRVSFEALTGNRGRVPPLLVEAARQMEHYFSGKRRTFDLPLQRLGTRFQRLVWQAIDEIPYGRTMTYQAIGERIGGRALGRTVGHACGSNPLPILVPCHRVIASDGLLTGYVGGLWRKKWLLEHEGALPRELFADPPR